MLCVARQIKDETKSRGRAKAGSLLVNPLIFAASKEKKGERQINAGCVGLFSFICRVTDVARRGDSLT